MQLLRFYKYLFHFLIICIILAVILGFSKRNDWYLYDTHLFSIEFPKEPKLDSQSLSTVIGKLNLEIASCEKYGIEDGNFAFSVISTAYPDSLLNSTKTEVFSSFFRSSIDGAVKNVNGKLLSEEIVENNGYPGRHIRIDFNQSMAIITMKLYLVNNRVIIVQTITKPAQENNISAVRFYNSFRIKK
jgi:hypothetical protein